MANVMVAVRHCRLGWPGVAASARRGEFTYTGTGESDAMAQRLHISVDEGVSTVIRRSP